MALIPPAVGSSGKEREEAEAALLWLAESGHRESVTAAASRHGEARPVRAGCLAELRPPAAAPGEAAQAACLLDPGLLHPAAARDRDAVLPPAAVDALGTMLAISPLGDPYAGIARVREACDSDSLGRFAWDLFSAWLAAGAPSKEAWAYHALAALGDEDGARRLGSLVRDDWPSAGEHNRAITGLDVLEALGSEAALFQLHRISQKGVTRGSATARPRKLDAVAAQRGLTPDDLEDFLVPAFGLGPDGSLPADLRPPLVPRGLRRAPAPVRPGLRREAAERPAEAGSRRRFPVAEQALLTWKELKRDVKAVAGQRLRRLEHAMCARRRWDARTFSTTQVQHPLAGHLARRLVWGAWDAQGRLLGTFRICEDQTFADPADEPWELPRGAGGTGPSFRSRRARPGRLERPVRRLPDPPALLPARPRGLPLLR